MTFPKLSGFIHFSKTFPGLENAVLKFHDFSRFFMTVRTLMFCVNKIWKFLSTKQFALLTERQDSLSYRYQFKHPIHIYSSSPSPHLIRFLYLQLHWRVCEVESSSWNWITTKSNIHMIRHHVPPNQTHHLPPYSVSFWADWGFHPLLLPSLSCLRRSVQCHF